MNGPRPGDAFGAMLEAALGDGGRPDRVFEIVERDDGHVRVNDASRYFLPSWGALDDWVYDRTRGRVLDVGCGAGRGALVLQDLGLDVVGLDVSPGAVEVCRRRGVRHVVTGTVETLAHDRGFDTFLLLGNNVGLLSGRQAAGNFLGRLADLAAGPGTRIVGTGVGREPGTALSPEDAEYTTANAARGRLRWQVTMRARFGALATDWFDYLFVTLEELEELLAGSPWVIGEHLEDGPGWAVRLDLR